MGLFTLPPNAWELAERAVKALESIAESLKAMEPHTEEDTPHHE